ncbi:hypothetical protein [Ornithinimicrobium flavum]|uniref:hypothetical protein n=1 Tax=Ornithinimicrobium flavum TaxID=1288636 RepID=UPI0013053D26|nr:hypothetical protein [Ornithinimicrobium flavum]
MSTATLDHPVLALPAALRPGARRAARATCGSWSRRRRRPRGRPAVGRCASRVEGGWP